MLDPLDPFLVIPGELRPAPQMVCASCGIRGEPSSDPLDHAIGWHTEPIMGYAIALGGEVIAGERQQCPVCAWEYARAVRAA
jgi:hypothetical protein